MRTALLLLALACSTPAADKGSDSPAPDDTADPDGEGADGGEGGGDDTGADDTGGGGEEPVGPPRASGCDANDYDVAIGEDGSQQVRTEHYLLLTHSGADAQDQARLLEAAYIAYTEDMGALPEASGPLEVLVFADQASWVAGMAARGVGVPATAGGYYDYATQTASLYQQPTLYFTEMLLLHEAFHQFHLQSRTREADLPTWYIEGLAEWVSRHDWDGACLTVGADPRGTIEDYWAAAASTLASSGSDLADWTADDAFPGRPEMMTFVHQQEWTRRDDWRAFREGMDFTGPGALPVDDAAYATHILDHQEPLWPVWLEWQHRTPTVMRGITPGVLSAALYKEAPATVSFEVPLGDAAYVGGIYGWSDAGFDIVFVDATGAVSRWIYTPDRNDWLNIDTLAEVGPTLLWEQSGDTLHLNGQEIALTPVLGPAAGFALYDGTADFTTLAD
jgi:hypothetical protein